MFDILIKNGLVYDGTISKPMITDIGIIGDKITALRTLHTNAKKVINASNLIVTPGFVDIHTHCDMAFKRTILKKFPNKIPTEIKMNHNLLHQGISTVVTGNCGLGYSDTAEWLNLTKLMNFTTNVFHLIPYGIVREDIFKEKQPEILSTKQLDLLKNRVSEEMEKGAIGISTGLEYAPGCFSSTAELIEIAKVVKRYNGIYTTHIRNETGKGEFTIIDSIKEAIEIGRVAEIPIEISHLKLGFPKYNVAISQVFELIENARNDGIDVTVDQYPYSAGNTMLTHILPDYFKTSNSIKDRYKTISGKKKIRDTISSIFKTLINPTQITISDYSERREFEGLTLDEIAEKENRNVSDCYTDMVCEKVSPWGIFFLTDEEDIKQIASKGYVITSSDSWTIQKDIAKPHPRFYGSFPKKIRKYVLEDKILSLEKAIYSMTSLPAGKFNLLHRGKIAAGYFADINVIDPDKIKDNATYGNPHQYPDGILYTIINGNIEYEKKST